MKKLLNFNELDSIYSAHKICHEVCVGILVERCETVCYEDCKLPR